jgi:hypothetical protein
MARKWQMSAERCHHRNVYVHSGCVEADSSMDRGRVPEDMYRRQTLEFSGVAFDVILRLSYHGHR